MDDVDGAGVILPRVGTPAPLFRLPAAGGREVGLADYRGLKSVVLWFSKGLF
jgi:peroxiredoxin